MFQTKMFNPVNKPGTIEKKEIIDFLYHNLENYGDPKADIEKCIEYAMKETPSFGGFVLVSYDGPTMTGVVVVNQTGMKDYIPENILVYIATHQEMRGQGIGKKLMADTIQMANGNIALHVEPDNPARFLYEKVGFTSKYIEMRLIK
ncbi:MAG: GNAT family N-acetyltransferase [Bacteroidetes bacterium GWF2_41_31]|nr:MAG: GNAT family N-acetyltransferase [Bacteroidetes bacterium GWF2_41_31]OFZ09379.1 MAG: GNAT family N-acetyltransferase [Bacteroidetes bacterium RIFOXYB12_FULL_41_6]